MKHLRLLLVGAISLGLSLSMSLSLAVAPPAVASEEEIPWQLGGGRLALAIGDFRFPSTGCHPHRGVLAVHANSESSYKKFWVDLDVASTADPDLVVAEWTDQTQVLAGTYFPTVRLCHPSLRPGSYTLQGTVTFWDHADEPWTIFLTDTFEVLPPRTSAVSVTKAPRGAHGWKVSGVARYDGLPWAGKRVLLQVRRSGGWRTVASKAADSRGRVALAHVPPRGAARTYRLHLRASAGAPDAASRSIRLRRR